MVRLPTASGRRRPPSKRRTARAIRSGFDIALSAFSSLRLGQPGTKVELRIVRRLGTRLDKLIVVLRLGQILERSVENKPLIPAIVHLARQPGAELLAIVAVLPVGYEIAGSAMIS